MFPKKNSPVFMTSAELEEAIRQHRSETKKLLAEVRKRRVKAVETNTELTPGGDEKLELEQ